MPRRCIHRVLHAQVQRCADAARYGLARVEIVIIIGCGVVGMTLVILFVGQVRNAGAGHDPLMRDGMQLKGVAQSFHLTARDHDSMIATPGLVRRLPVETGDGPRRIPGRGEVDGTANTTANLYSMMIAQNYFTPDLVVSRLDRNPHVRAKENYDWSSYLPERGTYWDETLVADLARESNASYAHLLLWGERKERRWRVALNADSNEVGILSSRGPRDGVGDPNSYTCNDRGNWRGNIIAGDSSVRRLTSLRGWEHIFRIDEGLDGSDPVLTFTLEIDAERGPTIQHD